MEWKKRFDELVRSDKQVFLYGLGGYGLFLGKWILASGGNFTGFCGRGYKKFPEGVFGKPVYSPDYLIENRNECYVLITAQSPKSKQEIMCLLEEKNFPKDHIFPIGFASRIIKPKTAGGGMLGVALFLRNGKIAISIMRKQEPPQRVMRKVFGIFRM